MANVCLHTVGPAQLLMQCSEQQSRTSSCLSMPFPAKQHGIPAKWRLEESSCLRELATLIMLEDVVAESNGWRDRVSSYSALPAVR